MEPPKKRIKNQASIVLRDSKTGNLERCPRSLLVASPVFSEILDDDKEDIDLRTSLLPSCPLEEAAHQHLMLLVTIVRRGCLNKGDLQISNAVHLWALALWLGLAAVVDQISQQLSDCPEDLTAMLAAVGPESAALKKLVQAGRLPGNLSMLEALIRDARRKEWCALCGESTIQLIKDLAAKDTAGLGLSHIALTAMEFGISPAQVQSLLPDGLRVRPGAIILKLKKKALGPEGVALLKLPSKLESLELSLAKCGIRAVGVAHLQLPTNLQYLHLDLRKCEIGAEGAKSLALPQTLVRLTLDLEGCKLGPAGAKHLRLPNSIKELVLSLHGCKIGPSGAADLKLPPSMLKLDLNLGLCEIAAEGARKLRFPSSLQQLRLNLGLCKIGDEGARQLPLPTDLEVLHIELDGCDISPTGLKSLEMRTGKLRLLQERKFILDKGQIQDWYKNKEGRAAPKKEKPTMKEACREAIRELTLVSSTQRKGPARLDGSVSEIETPKLGPEKPAVLPSPEKSCLQSLLAIKEEEYSQSEIEEEAAGRPVGLTKSNQNLGGDSSSEQDPARSSFEAFQKNFVPAGRKGIEICSAGTDRQTHSADHSLQKLQRMQAMKKEHEADERMTRALSNMAQESEDERQRGKMRAELKRKEKDVSAYLAEKSLVPVDQDPLENVVWKAEKEQSREQRMGAVFNVTVHPREKGQLPPPIPGIVYDHVNPLASDCEQSQSDWE